MVKEIVPKLLNDLNQLLEDEVSPHTISYQFEKIAALLSKEKLRIDKVDCNEYYEDRDLCLILLMKNEALANAQFEQASKFRFIEIELLMIKGDKESTQLKIEPFFFEYRNNCVTFHYNKRKENQRLIANLIERYNLVHQKSNPVKMLFADNFG